MSTESQNRLSSSRIDVRLPPNWADEQMRSDIREALAKKPIILPPKWLYDERGSQLFDEITKLSEYYPTESERNLLKDYSDEIAETSQANSVVELGSGTSDKTRTLLDAFYRKGQLKHFQPMDVSEEPLRQAADLLSERYEGVQMAGLVGDFNHDLGHIVDFGSPRLMVFLGGTIGNFYSSDRQRFLESVASTLKIGDWFLLGFDPIKPVEKIVAAYNDSKGVTAQFVSNVLQVINTKLGADFAMGSFDYSPLWDQEKTRMDLRLRSALPQVVTIPGLDMQVELFEGEEIRVEISTKFQSETLEKEVERAGMEPSRVFSNGKFSLLLARACHTP